MGAFARPVLRRAVTLSDADVFKVITLLPDLGVQGPLPPTGNGDCFGPVPDANKPGHNISVPCQCPPNRVVYIDSLFANIRTGFAVNNTGVPVTFPLSSSVVDAQTRINAVVVTLQNLEGPGKGCPLSSTTLSAQRKKLEDDAERQTSFTLGTAPSTSQTQTQVSASASASTISTFTSTASSSEDDQATRNITIFDTLTSCPAGATGTVSVSASTISTFSPVPVPTTVTPSIITTIFATSTVFTVIPTILTRVVAALAETEP